jgi:hypothetical protein
MGETEDKVMQDEAKRLEDDRQKWIVERKRQRDHFKLLGQKMIRLNKNSDVDTAEEIWKNHIEPNLDKQE